MLRFIARLIVGFLKIFSLRYWITRKTVKDTSEEDAQKLMDFLKKK